MKHFSVAIQIWLLSFTICAGAIAFSFLCTDLPIARCCAPFGPFASVLGEGLGSAIILSLETIAAASLILTRLIRGKLSPFAEALAVAFLTSICSYAINSNVLKLSFGVPNPSAVMRGAEHAFFLWKGSPDSSFPSGHMVLVASFAGVFMRLYRASVWPLSMFLLLAAGLLVVGHWHFLSDVIAGAFLGISAGLLAGELWEVHSSSRSLRALTGSTNIEA